jgi:hypothetical protein
LFVFLPLPVYSKSCPPLSDPFLKLDPRLCNLLLRHCICIMNNKHIRLQNHWTTFYLD